MADTTPKVDTTPETKAPETKVAGTAEPAKEETKDDAEKPVCLFSVVFR